MNGNCIASSDSAAMNPSVYPLSRAPKHTAGGDYSNATYSSYLEPSPLYPFPGKSSAQLKDYFGFLNSSSKEFNNALSMLDHSEITLMDGLGGLDGLNGLSAIPMPAIPAPTGCYDDLGRRIRAERRRSSIELATMQTLPAPTGCYDDLGRRIRAERRRSSIELATMQTLPAPMGCYDDLGRRIRAERRRSSIELAKALWQEMALDECTAVPTHKPSRQIIDDLHYPIEGYPGKISEAAMSEIISTADAVQIPLRRLSEDSSETASASASASADERSTTAICTDGRRRSLSSTTSQPSFDMARLIQYMTMSQRSLKELQQHDKSQGLPTSHCHTMVQTERSRKQLQLGRILKKHDGTPLIRAEIAGDGTVMFVENKRKRRIDAQTMVRGKKRRRGRPTGSGRRRGIPVNKTAASA